ncbi:tumor necrosis factor receptor superfamily member 14-like isoform X2 [Salvelinus sp. IW2-2015]|uniref:tumor necrosis factor receptor superfamily member 14-like isoform X2 n=1 Tax=Salvelinus sp. IW2-2015 TaxID=2691554 RepID=UPI0038D3ED01
METLIWTITIVLVHVSIGCCIACGRAEYRIGDECCLMCWPGYHVHSHCTKSTSIPSCVPCIDSTFLDEPSGKTTCNNCTTCDPGLKVKQPCTPSSDTVCGTLEGFYCLDPTKDGCRAAQRHSSCKPGQYISHTGTASTDTVCADCPGDTYSNGSFTACQPHTECKSLGLQELRPGTHLSNSECGPQSSQIEPGIIIGVVLASVPIAPAIIRRRRRRRIVILRRRKSPTPVTFSPVTVNAVEIQALTALIITNAT